jgi:NAD(P)H-dependent flavin oxidoreductase YrpB (nitropropane dioxygenase family)
VAKLPDLIIGDLRINPPIVQGGMGVNISRANLASAVANEGAVGTISAITGGFTQIASSNMHEKELREQIRQARQKTSGILAVNILVALTNYDDIVRAAADEGIDIIFSGAGLPLHLPKLVEGTKAKICPIVSSARTADIICRSWARKHNRLPDAIVVEGPMAGGHLGYSFSELEQEPQGKLENILDEVLAVAARYRLPDGRAIPVIAAGGIFDGKDIARLLRQGASGIQMGTRFVCTDECDASDEFKQAYLHARKEDITIINSPVGLPGRALLNEFLERARKHEIKFACHYRCLKTCDPSQSPYCIADALLNAAKGNLEAGFVFVGSNVYRVKEIVPVKTLIRELTLEAEKEFTAAC